MAGGTGCEAGMLRVLLIAPTAPGLPPLRWWNEFATLTAIEGARVDVLAGSQATIDTVAKTLRRGTDIVIVAGHGAQNQIILSDNRRVSGEWLATQARKSPPECILVGACFSGQRDDRYLESIGEAISQAGIHALVFETDIADESAAVYSVEFVRAMVATFDVVRANRVAITSIAQSDQALALGARLVPGVVNGYREFARRFEAIECQIKTLQAGQETILRILQPQPS